MRGNFTTYMSHVPTKPLVFLLFFSLSIRLKFQ